MREPVTETDGLTHAKDRYDNLLYKDVKHITPVAVKVELPPVLLCYLAIYQLKLTQEQQTALFLRMPEDMSTWTLVMLKSMLKKIQIINDATTLRETQAWTKHRPVTAQVKFLDSDTLERSALSGEEDGPDETDWSDEDCGYIGRRSRPRDNAPRRYNAPPYRSRSPSPRPGGYRGRDSRSFGRGRDSRSSYRGRDSRGRDSRARVNLADDDTQEPDDKESNPEVEEDVRFGKGSDGKGKGKGKGKGASELTCYG